MSNNSMRNTANKNEVFLGGLPLDITTGKYSSFRTILIFFRGSKRVFE